MKRTRHEPEAEMQPLFYLNSFVKMLNFDILEAKHSVYTKSLEGVFAYLSSIGERYKVHEVKSIVLTFELKQFQQYNVNLIDATFFTNFLKLFPYVEEFRIHAISGVVRVHNDAAQKLANYISVSKLVYAEYPGMTFHACNMLASRRMMIPFIAFYHASLSYYPVQEDSGRTTVCSRQEVVCVGFIEELRNLFSRELSTKEKESVAKIKVCLSIESGLEAIVSKEDCNNLLSFLSIFPNARKFKFEHDHESSIFYEFKFAKPSAVDEAVISHPSICKAQYEGVQNSVKCMLKDKELLINDLGL